MRIGMMILVATLAFEGFADMPMLTWLGRDKMTNDMKNVVLKILTEDESLSYGDKASENMLVHGDNLEALKSLLPFYAGRVKCIYIDPPYNTGSAFEHYDDNVEHSTWLNMMYPRLKLLREFLTEDGSIWISIDDREGAYLRVICDEIFGRQNFISQIHWQRSYSTKGDSKSIVTAGEYLLCFRKSSLWVPNRLSRTEEMNKKYKNPDGDIASWRSDNPYASDAKTHQGMVYAIQHPFDGRFLYPTMGSHWRYGQNEMLNILNGWCEYELKELNDAQIRANICGVPVNEVRQGVKAIVLAKPIDESRNDAKAILKKGPWPKFFFGKDGTGGISRKTYLTDVGGVAPTNWWSFDEVGHTDEAKKEILRLFDGQAPFATPKPERLIQRVLTIATNPGDLVMDSFLGSGTTAAVAHKMGRKWIGIEMGEHAKTHCAVRLKKVVDGEQGGISRSVNWQGGGGFRFYELGEPLLKEDGTLTENIPFEVMAAHVWFSETGRHYVRPAAKTTALGVDKGVAYALLYNGILHDRSVGGGNVLTKKTLSIIKEDLKEIEYEKLVVYGEATRLMESTLSAENIEFRQTPYDLVLGR